MALHHAESNAVTKHTWLEALIELHAAVSCKSMASASDTFLESGLINDLILALLLSLLQMEGCR